MEEQMVPGDYAALGPLHIRLQMKTTPSTNIVGGYSNGEPFRVYEVYPEVSGILWGRVSSNTGEGQIRYVGLRVNNHPKAKLTKAYVEETQGGTSVAMANAINRHADAVENLAEAVWAWVKKQG